MRTMRLRVFLWHSRQVLPIDVNAGRDLSVQTARAAAGAALNVSDVVEAVKRVDTAVVQTWVAHTAATLADELPAEAWRRLAVANGAKGPRAYDWAALRVSVGADAWPGPERWLLVRRSLADPTERAHYLSNAPEGTPLEELARVAGVWQRHCG